MVNYSLSPTVEKTVQEIWKDVVGYEGFYKVSDQGNVKSCDRYVSARGGSIAFRKGRILKQMTKQTGYKAVSLSRGTDDKKQFLVHRLVAAAFLINPFNKPLVNHLNAKKVDNRLVNLEYCTAKENGLHASKMGLINPKRKSTPFSQQKIEDEKSVNVEITMSVKMRKSDVNESEITTLTSLFESLKYTIN
jgi:NUMOD4 motif.